MLFLPSPDIDILCLHRYNIVCYYFFTDTTIDLVWREDRYTYDAWGKLLTVTDTSGNDVSGNPNHIANINPIRYRSYLYDTESGFYYLVSRYYDPDLGRFINGDGQLNTNSMLGYNLFAYCENDPVNMSDPQGNLPLHRKPNLIINDGGGNRISDNGEPINSFSASVVFTVAGDLLKIVVNNISASAGFSMGLSAVIECENLNIDLTPVRMDIMGVQFKDGEFKIGHPGHVGASVGYGPVQLGSSSDVFESFGGAERIVYEDEEFDLSVGLGLSAVALVGYHWDVSISLSGIVKDVIEYIEVYQEAEV